METQLTNDAEYLLCVLYEAYRQRRNNGELTPDAKVFGDPEEIQSKYCSNWLPSDIEEAGRELSRSGLVVCDWGDDTFDTLILESAGIAMMERRFADKADKLLERIATLRTIIFG